MRKHTLKTLPENQQIMSTISFCIPRMDTRSLPESIDEIKAFVKSKFANIMNLNVNDIDIIAKYTDQGYLYYTAFIHPKHPSGIIYNDFVADIDANGKTKVHFDRWFWNVRKNNLPRPSADSAGAADTGAAAIPAIPDVELGFTPEEEEELFAELDLAERTKEWFDVCGRMLLQQDYIDAGPTLEQLLEQEDRRVCAHLREIM